LGIIDEKHDAEVRHARAAELKPQRQTVRLLGRHIPALAADDGTLRAEEDGKPAAAKSVQSYIARAFGDRLGEARAAMDALAASLPPEELNRVGFGAGVLKPSPSRSFSRSGAFLDIGHRVGGAPSTVINLTAQSVRFLNQLLILWTDSPEI
jgi:hypothetical protein